MSHKILILSEEDCKFNSGDRLRIYKDSKIFLLTSFCKVLRIEKDWIDIWWPEVEEWSRMFECSGFYDSLLYTVTLSFSTSLSIWALFIYCFSSFSFPILSPVLLSIFLSPYTSSLCSILFSHTFPSPLLPTFSLLYCFFIFVFHNPF